MNRAYSVLELQAQVTGFIETCERTRKSVFPGGANLQPRSPPVRQAFPASHELRKAGGTPARNLIAEGGRQSFRKSVAIGRTWPCTERRRRGLAKIGGRHQVDTEAGNHSLRTSFEKNSGQFRVIEQQVVRPFEPQVAACGKKNTGRFMKRHPCK